MATLLATAVELGVREVATRPPVTAHLSSQNPSQLVIHHLSNKFGLLIDPPLSMVAKIVFAFIMGLFF